MTTKTAARAAAPKPTARKPAKRIPAPRADLVTRAAAETTSRFHQSLARVLLHEGGRANHPKDPGGRTNKGHPKNVGANAGNQGPDVGWDGLVAHMREQS